MTSINQFTTLLKTSNSIAKQYGKVEEYETLSKLLDHCYDNRLSLLVCGEFKRGKSSLINALLNDDICVVADGIATSAVSVIKYGAEPKVIRYFSTYQDDSTSTQSMIIKSESIKFDSIYDYTKGSSMDIDNTLYLEIEIPNAFLKSKGLTLIDTPGIGSLDPRHLFLTLQSLPKADAIFFVTDTAEPMLTTELDFLKDKIIPLNKPFEIILTKSDLVSREELSTYMNDVEEKASNYCGAKVNCIPISSSEWYNYNHATSETIRERRRKNSNCDALLSIIDGFYNRKINSMECLFRNQYVDFLNSLREVIEKSISDLTQITTDNDIKGYRQQLDEMKTLREMVLNEDSEFRVRINAIIESSQDCVLEEFSRDSVLLSTDRLEDVLKDERAGDENGDKFVIEQMNHSIQKISSNIDKKIDSAISQVVGELKELIDNVILTNKTNETRLNGDLVPVSHSFSENFVNLTRQALPFMGVASISGGITVAGLSLGAGILGLTSIAAVPILGACVGLAAGIFYVVQSIKGTKRQEALNNIRKQVSPRISIAINEMRSYIQKRYSIFSKEVVKTLKSISQNMTDQMQEKVKLMQECEKDAQKRTATIKELQSHLTMINNLIVQTKVVNTNPFVS